MQMAERGKPSESHVVRTGDLQATCLTSRRFLQSNILVCGFWRLSSRQFIRNHGTGMSREPAGWRLLCRKDLIRQVRAGPLRAQRHLTPALSPKHSFGGEGGATRGARGLQTGFAGHGPDITKVSTGQLESLRHISSASLRLMFPPESGRFRPIPTTLWGWLSPSGDLCYE